MPLTDEQKQMVREAMKQTSSQPQQETQAVSSWEEIDKIKTEREAKKRLLEKAKMQEEEKKKHPIASFLKGAGKFVVGVAKSIGETGLRAASERTLGMVDPGKQLRKEFIPETVDLPIVGETSIRYSDEPKKAVLQAGEDVLNAFPGLAQTKTAARLVEEGAEGFSGKLMSSAFKIRETDLRKNPNLIKEFLQERISGLTKKGIAKKANEVVNASENALDLIVDEASRAGKKIDSKEVVKATKDLINFYENSAFPEMADTVRKKVDDFVKKGEIDVKEAQEFKKNTYAILRNSYGKLTNAEDETAKQIARGVKEQLEIAIPEIKNMSLNKKLAIYGKARDLMERRINSAGPNELLTFKDVVLTSGSNSLIPSLVRMTIESVPFKTYVANALTSQKTQKIKNLAEYVTPFVKELFIKDQQETK